MYGGFVTTALYLFAKIRTSSIKGLSDLAASLLQHSTVGQYILHSLGNRRELLDKFFGHTDQGAERLAMLKQCDQLSHIGLSNVPFDRQVLPAEQRGTLFF